MRERTNHDVGELTIATLNVAGLPRFRQNARTKSLLQPYPVRFNELCRQLESSSIDILNLQEVFTHHERRFLTDRLPSFGYSAFEPAALGPKGALITFSRVPIKKVAYDSYFSATKSIDRNNLPFFSLVKSGLKGILVARAGEQNLSIVNTHPLANDDWDWSPTNRFYSLQQAQLSKLTSVLHQLVALHGDRVVLGADLNAAKDSQLFEHFLAKSVLGDIFGADVAPTFQPEFLIAGQNPACLDVLLASRGLATTATQKQRLFSDKSPSVGYLTDHQGLRATITV